MRHVTLALVMVFCALSATPGITQEEAGFDVEKISERVILVTDRAEGTEQLAIASEVPGGDCGGAWPRRFCLHDQSRIQAGLFRRE